jgi:hypothetical protein
MTYRGFIQEFRGATPGGLAMLWIRRADGSIDEVPCEQAIAAAALLRWFDCDAEQESLSPAARQAEVVYSVDDLGILIAFTPYDRWLFTSRPEIPADGIDDDAIYWAVQKIIRTGKIS